ncbi:MAG: amidohydrolase family protein [Spirochaetaceae bacterium]|nr:amidohydrolase family protein [Spirochaetaceae bacterium]
MKIQRIIDAHVHIGRSLNFDMKETDVLEAMKKYNIEKVLVSNSESAEADHEQKLLPQELQISQVKSLEKSIKFAKENSGKVYVAPWFKPKTEKISDELINLIQNNLDVIKAVKFHPYHSALDFDDPLMNPYLDLAEQFNLHVITHTGTGENDCPEKVYNMAKSFPKVNFIMAHMGLGSDNVIATELIALLPNLFGDTAWVSMESTINFINKIGSQKLFFGTDLPIDGIDTYHHNPRGERSLYQDYFEKLPEFISQEDYDNLMWKNALTFFGLE